MVGFFSKSNRLGNNIFLCTSMDMSLHEPELPPYLEILHQYGQRYEQKRAAILQLKGFIHSQQLRLNDAIAKNEELQQQINSLTACEDIKQRLIALDCSIRALRMHSARTSDAWERGSCTESMIGGQSAAVRRPSEQEYEAETQIHRTGGRG